MEPQQVTYTRELADKYNFECEIFYHEQSGRTTEDASKALNLDSDRLDLKVLEELSGTKGLSLAKESDIKEKLGFEIGGIPCLIFHEKEIKTYIDKNVLELGNVAG